MDGADVDDLDINDYLYGTGTIAVAESDVDTTYDIPLSSHDDLGTTSEIDYIDRLSDDDPMKQALRPTNGQPTNLIIPLVIAFLIYRSF